jgi:hypothetical protein
MINSVSGTDDWGMKPKRGAVMKRSAFLRVLGLSIVVPTVGYKIVDLISAGARAGVEAPLQPETPVCMKIDQETCNACGACEGESPCIEVGEQYAYFVECEDCTPLGSTSQCCAAGSSEDFQDAMAVCLLECITVEYDGCHNGCG